MKLIADWRQSWRLWSVRASLIGALLSALAAAPDTLLTVWQSLPDEMRGVVPAHLSPWIAPALFLLTSVARLVRQQDAGK